MSNHRRIYEKIIKLLDGAPLTRGELIERLTSQGSGITQVGKLTEARGVAGSVIDEMAQTGVITLTEGKYILSASRPVALRAESCEREILLLLKKAPRTKLQIRSALEERFGTAKTPSLRDDDALFSYVGQILKRLLKIGILTISEGKYRIAPERAASVDAAYDMLGLKEQFLTRLHTRGGEFFEHYFMTLLSKYLSKHGKTVLECYTTGGAEDGGIDGIVKTVDSLGFRETVMVQTKNRTDVTSETSIRGFYGAVCALQGSRGIFVTTSEFHPMAKKFLDSIDNCVGVDGEKLFLIARECLYGIKRRGGKYVVDTKLI